MSGPPSAEDELDEIPRRGSSSRPAGPPGTNTAVLDASVLINFLILDRTVLFRNLPGLEFVVPEAVEVEVRRDDQRRTLATSLASGEIRLVRVESFHEIAAAESLRRDLGAGEANRLALAESRGWIVACDEGGRFRRQAIQRLGEARLLTTPGLLLRAIRAGVLTVPEADAMPRRTR